MKILILALMLFFMGCSDNIRDCNNNGYSGVVCSKYSNNTYCSDNERTTNDDIKTSQGIVKQDMYEYYDIIKKENK
ncbi:MAG: hypothetical protein PHF21_02730 [Bacilli bacterium]|nr:hypothetical protein [Bacilli bacterium]